MAARKRRAVRQTKRVTDRTTDVAPPTPETLSKLRRDVLERLLREGRIRDEHFRAANDIRRVWEAVGRAMFPSTSSVGSPRQPHMKRNFREPAQRLSDSEEIIWRRRYRPWADEMSVPIVAGTVRVSRLQIVLDVIVDNYGIRQIESDKRAREGEGIRRRDSRARRGRRDPVGERGLVVIQGVHSLLISIRFRGSIGSL